MSSSTFVTLLAMDVPSVVVTTSVLLQVPLRRLMWSVRRPEGEVSEKGPVGPYTPAVGEHPEELVDQILAQVVAILRPPGGSMGWLSQTRSGWN